MFQLLMAYPDFLIRKTIFSQRQVSSQKEKTTNIHIEKLNFSYDFRTEGGAFHNRAKNKIIPEKNF